MSILISPSITLPESHFDDVYRGTSVIIAARWLLVAAGLVFVLYRPQSTADLTVGVLSVLGIAVTNFWLQMRPLKNQPVEPLWTYLASAADLAVISGLILMHGDASSKTFAFYYPAIVAYSLVFPSSVTGILTGGVLCFVFYISDAPLGGHGGEMTFVARILTLAAMTFIGGRYRRVEELRLARRSEVSAARFPYLGESSRIEAQEDVYYGQIVCAAARWFVIAGALCLTLFQVHSIASMERSLIPLILMIAANFYLHARYMMGLPANAMLLKLASAADVAVITAVIIGGNSEYFIFYYPVVFAFALVFARRNALLFTAVVAVGYTALFVLLPPGIQFNGDEKTLAIRLVTLFATAMLGAMYWRIQRTRTLREIR
jgi:hypothetical protein